VHEWPPPEQNLVWGWQQSGGYITPDHSVKDMLLIDCVCTEHKEPVSMHPQRSWECEDHKLIAPPPPPWKGQLTFLAGTEFTDIFDNSLTITDNFDCWTLGRGASWWTFPKPYCLWTHCSIQTMTGEQMRKPCWLVASGLTTGMTGSPQASNFVSWCWYA
jgi:hypothetical protein